MSTGSALYYDRLLWARFMNGCIVLFEVLMLNCAIPISHGNFDVRTQAHVLHT